MKTTVSTKDLKATLVRTKLALGKKGVSLPILASVKIAASETAQQVTFTTTNLDLTSAITVDAQVSEPGVVIVSQDEITKMVGSKAAEVTILNVAGDSNKAQMVAGKTRLTTYAYSLKDYPTVHDLGDFVETKIDGAHLAEAATAASHDDTRPILNGVAIIGHDLMSTDSYRLYVLRFKEAILPNSGKAIFPLDFVKAIMKTKEPITLQVGATAAIARFGNECWTSRLVDGEFPNYKSLIPAETPASFKFNRTELVEAVAEVQRLVPDRLTPIRVETVGGPVNISKMNASGLKAEVDVEGSLTDVSVFALDGKYFGDLLDGTSTDVLRGVDQHKPWMLTESAEGFERIRLLMPVRIN